MYTRRLALRRCHSSGCSRDGDKAPSRACTTNHESLCRSRVGRTHDDSSNGRFPQGSCLISTAAAGDNMKRGGAGKRRDSTEAAIIATLRSYGAFVQQCHGAGAPDLLVCFGNRWCPLEVKSPHGPIRSSQTRYPIVRTPEEAVTTILDVWCGR